jgi:hypothetical protein
MYLHQDNYDLWPGQIKAAIAPHGVAEWKMRSLLLPPILGESTMSTSDLDYSAGVLYNVIPIGRSIWMFQLDIHSVYS